MSSPRSTPKPVCLEPRTFGDTPAAIYLVECLNARNNPLVARKAAKVLGECRELMADLARAHLDYDALSTRTLARLLPLIGDYGRARVEEGLRKDDSHIADLTLNVMAGNLKTWRGRVQAARRRERDIARTDPHGTAQEWVPATPLADEKTSEDLRVKSKRTLARKGKVDTLY